MEGVVCLDERFAAIRFDAATQKASVLDVIQIVTYLPQKNLSEIYKRLEKELTTRCEKLRISVCCQLLIVHLFSIT